MSLQPVDSADEPRQQRIGAASEVVPLDRQLVDPLEQHREPLGGPEHGLQRVDARSGRAQDQRRELNRGGHEQLVVAALEPPFQPRSRRIRACLRGRQQQHLLGATPLLDEPQKAALQSAGLARPGRPEHKQRFAIAGDRVALNGKQGVKGEPDV